MKKLLGISGAILGLIAMASAAQAQETAVQIYSFDQLSAGEAAGIDGFTGWQTLQATNGAFFPYGQQNTTLETTTGLGVTLTYDGYYNQNYGGPTIAGDPGSTTLFRDGVGTTGAPETTGQPYGPNPVTMTLSGLTAGDAYSLAVYIGGSGYNPSEGSVSLTGASTQYFMTARGGNYYPAQPNVFLDGASTSDFIASAIVANSGNQNIQTTGAYYGAGNSASTYMSNYLVFNFVDAGPETLTLSQLGSFGSNNSFSYTANPGNVIGLNGFELINDGAGVVPEPSVAWMFSLGFLGLMVHVYRKRYVKA